MLKIKRKEKILKASRKKITHSHKGEQLLEITDFSSEITEPRRQWSNTIKVLKNKTTQPRILYQIKMFFKNKIKLKTFSDKSKPSEVIIRRFALQETLKEIF